MKATTLRAVRLLLALFVTLALATGPMPTLTAEQTNALPKIKQPDVVFVPTPQPVVEKMLEMAEVKKGDVVYDLGCGDGRIVVTAAKKYGVKAVGFDIDPQRVKEANENVKSNKVEHLVTIRQEDIFTLDLREASVVTLYLLPDLNVRLMPQLAKLKPGSRIVSHDFDMRGTKPVQVQRLTIESPETSDESEEGHDDGSHTIYKWVVPWEAETAGSGSAGKAASLFNAPSPSGAGCSPAAAKP